MKSDEEIFDIVIKRRNEYVREKRKRKKVMGVSALCICCAALVTFGALAAGKTGQKIRAGSAAGKNEMHQSSCTTAEADSAPVYASENEESAGSVSVQANQKTTVQIVTQQSTRADSWAVPPEQNDGDSKSGGTYGSDSSAILPPASENFGIKLKGSGISAEELEKYITENAKSIVSAIAFDSAYGSGEYKVCTSGYRHLTVDDSGFWVNIDFVDCPVTKNGKIVGVVTVYKDDGKLYNCPAYGGPWFANMQKAFDENPGSELAFVYLGEASEIIISPENKIYGMRSADYEEGDYYAAYSGNGNTFSSDKLSIGVTVNF